jgi:ferritin-like metal-binding protein YciE
LLNRSDITGHSAAITALRQPLGEEQAMAQWIDDHLAETTRTFVLRYEAGEPAAH